MTWHDRKFRNFLCLILVLTFTGCNRSSRARAQTAPAAAQSAFALASPAFHDQGAIPAQYGCTGSNFSPPLEWSNPPAATKSFTLIVTDPDAPSGNFAHWIVYDLPATTRSLPQALSADERMSQGGTQGKNNFGKIGYGGPCPPTGAQHHYVFKLYALDSMLGLPSGASASQVEQAMQGHVLAEADLTGTFGK
jgi:Raf kinase inhibitor-like YbhB/YbcL family protein